MNVLHYVVPFVVALGALILFHELGHYAVARWFNVKVLRFSIGFGKPLLIVRRGPDRTEWVLAAIPLGGFVRMLDEREAEVAASERHRAFNRQSVGRRFAIVAAGPLANFLLAIVVYWALFLTGTEELRARVSVLEAPNVAVSAGFSDGDDVQAINGDPVHTWQALRWQLLDRVLDGDVVRVEVVTLDGLTQVRQLDMRGLSLDGEGDLIARMGLRPWRPPIDPIVGSLAPGGPAERAGLLPGDRIIGLDEVSIADWQALVDHVQSRPGEPVRVRFERMGQIETRSLTLEAHPVGERLQGRIGIGVAPPAEDDAGDMFVTVQHGPVEALGAAMTRTWDTTVLSLRMIGRMLTGDVSWKNLSGPVTIADFAGRSARLGLEYYLGFVALISISLGVLNLLPIPLLDGGHLMFYTVEILRGKPVPERVMVVGQQVGMALLLTLMVFAFYNDLSRLFGH